MNWGRLLLDAFVLAVGVILLADAAGAFDAGEVIGDWWPLAVISAGGFENVTAKETLAAGSPALDVNATVLFGGLEVKH